MMGISLVILLMSIIALIFAYFKIRKENLSVKKFISLILLAPLLTSISLYMLKIPPYFSDIEEFKYFNFLLQVLLAVVLLLMLMLPSLILYSLYTLSLEKKFSLSKLRLSILAGLIGGISASPYLIIMPLRFIFFPIIIGSLSVMIVYFISSRIKNEN